MLLEKTFFSNRASDLYSGPLESPVIILNALHIFATKTNRIIIYRQQVEQL